MRTAMRRLIAAKSKSVTLLKPAFYRHFCVVLKILRESTRTK